MILGLLILVDFIILTSWEISDHVRRQTRELMPEVTTLGTTVRNEVKT